MQTKPSTQNAEPNLNASSSHRGWGGGKDKTLKKTGLDQNKDIRGRLHSLTTSLGCFLRLRIIEIF